MEIIQADQYVFGSFGSKGYHIPACSAGAVPFIRQIDERYKYFGDPQPHPEIQQHYFAAPLTPSGDRMIIGTFSMTGTDNLNRRDALVSRGILVDALQYQRIGANPYLLFNALKLDDVAEKAQSQPGGLPVVEISVEPGWILPELRPLLENLTPVETQLLYDITKSLWLQGKVRLPLNTKNADILKLAVSITPIYLKQKLGLTTYSRLLGETLYFDVTLSVNKPLFLNNNSVIPAYFDSRLDEVLDYIKDNSRGGFEAFLQIPDLKPIPKPSKIKRMLVKFNPFSGSKKR